MNSEQVFLFWPWARLRKGGQGLFAALPSITRKKNKMHLHCPRPDTSSRTNQFFFYLFLFIILTEEESLSLSIPTNGPECQWIKSCMPTVDAAWSPAHLTRHHTKLDFTSYQSASNGAERHNSELKNKNRRQTFQPCCTPWLWPWLLHAIAPPLQQWSFFIAILACVPIVEIHTMHSALPTHYIHYKSPNGNDKQEERAERRGREKKNCFETENTKCNWIYYKKRLKFRVLEIMKPAIGSL